MKIAPCTVVIKRDTLGSPEVRERLESLLPTWRFPAPARGAQRFAYPFTFRPVSSLPATSQ